jgi:hypothetical protein
LQAAFTKLNLAAGLSDRTYHVVPYSFDRGSVSVEEVQASFQAFLSGQDVVGVVSSVRDSEYAAALSQVSIGARLVYVSPRGVLSAADDTPYSSYRVYVGGSLRDEAFAAMKYASLTLGLVGAGASGSVGLIVEASSVSGDILTSMKLAVSEYKGIVGYSGTYASLAQMQSVMDDVGGSLAGVNVVMVYGTNYVVEGLSYLRSKPGSAGSMPVFVISSEMDAISLQQALLSHADNTYVTLLTPSPYASVLSDNGSVSDSSALVGDSRAALGVMNGSLVLNSAQVEGFLTGMLLSNIAAHVFGGSAVTSPLLMQALYSTAVFSIDEVYLGSYVDQSCTSYSSSSNCECAQGMHGIWMVKLLSPASETAAATSTGGLSTLTFSVGSEGYYYSMLSNVNYTLQFDTCGVVPTPAATTPSNAGSSLTSVIIPIIAALGGVGGVALVLFIVYSVFAKRRRQAAAMKAAPQGAVTLVFTDVQDSTKLWDTCEGMSEALDMHNEIMRQTIARHKVWLMLTFGLFFTIHFIF